MQTYVFSGIYFRFSFISTLSNRTSGRDQSSDGSFIQATRQEGMPGRLKDFSNFMS